MGRAASAEPTSLTVERSRRISAHDDLGPWLRGLREEAGLTQAESAEAIGAEVRSLRRWETSADVPNGLSLLRALSAYGVRLSKPPPVAVPRATNAELATMRGTLDEIRDGVQMLAAGSALGRTQVLLRLIDAGGEELRTELRAPLLHMAQQEREAGRLMIEQADLLEQRLAG